MNTHEMLKPNIWAKRTVERCKRKERHRTGRAVKTATLMAENVSASLPAHMHPLNDMLATACWIKETATQRT
ncbi:MAG: hypothetical protein ABI234_00135 [Ktedonobacteraceae bacterium]